MRPSERPPQGGESSGMGESASRMAVSAHTKVLQARATATVKEERVRTARLVGTLAPCAALAVAGGCGGDDDVRGFTAGALRG
jgi:hypothetical protein